MGLKTIWRCRYLLACTLLTPLVVQAQAPKVQVASQTTIDPIGVVTPERLAQPPALSASRQAAIRAEVARRANLMLPVGEQVPVPNRTDLAPGALEMFSPNGAPAPAVPGAPPIISVSSPLAPGSAFLPTSEVGEPSVAQSGGTVFYTGNWYAASAATANPMPTDYAYIDPSADMPDFCCDQDVTADPGRGMFLWTRLGGTNGRFLLSESTDQTLSFCSYELNPGQLGYANAFYDQPLVALSNNFVYISANVFNALPPSQFLHEVLLKLSLDELQDCGAVTLNSFNLDAANGWGGLVSGATTEMYFGSHRGFNNSFTIFWNPENTNSLFSSTQAIPAFTFQNRNSSCVVSGTNPCGRSDSRVQSGWVRRGAHQSVGEIGFRWDAHEGGGFAWAYVDGATFRQDNFAFTGSPLTAFSNVAVEYPYDSPNVRGDLGRTWQVMGGAFFPSTVFQMDDDYSTGAYFQIQGGGGSANAWGDYVRNRAYLPCGTGWVSAGHTIQGGMIEPRFYVISRQRDVPCINRTINLP